MRELEVAWCGSSPVRGGRYDDDTELVGRPEYWSVKFSEGCIYLGSDDAADTNEDSVRAYLLR